jgi:coproporphyrinogen III oxidase-like Fe-S oxidoreductase
MSLRRFGITFAEPDPPPTPEEVARAFPAVPGLYLHVPFCSTLCPFCPYNKVRHRDDLAAAYLRRLEREADRYLGALPGPFPSLYVGGGTPTLCLDGMARLLGRLPVTGERAIEVLPAHMTTDGAMRLEDIGFDFVSIGVQSFDAGVLRRLRRPGSPAINRAAVETAVGRFACVDVDLIFDTAYDEPGVLLDDLETCFEHGVDQVSTYPLMRFGYTPFGRPATTGVASIDCCEQPPTWPPPTATSGGRCGPSTAGAPRPTPRSPGPTTSVSGRVRRRSPAACSR